MVDQLANVKALYEDTVYPLLQLLDRVRGIPHIGEHVLGEGLNAYMEAFTYLANAIKKDDPAWRANEMNEPRTESSSSAAVKNLYRQVARDAIAIRRVAPYNSGPTVRQLAIFGQESDPPEDCFMTRLEEAIKLDDPTWTP